MRKYFALFAVLFVFALLAYAEVPDFNISRKQKNYNGFRFEVYTHKRDLMHKQFEIYDVVVAITPSKRKNIEHNISAEVWDDRQFIYSATLTEDRYENLSLNIQKKIKDKKALLFFFQINPKFAKKTWLNYQIVRNDGSVEMNCVITLKDYIKLANQPCTRTGIPLRTIPASNPSR